MRVAMSLHTQEGTIGQDRPLLIVWKRRFSVLAFLTVVGGLGVGEVFFYDFLRVLGIVEFLRARFPWCALY